MQAAHDFTLHNQLPPINLEKWYVDVLLPAGGVVLIYAGTLTVAGRRFSRVTIDLFQPGGATLHGSAAVNHLEGGAGWLRCSALSIEGETLRFTTPGLSGGLRYAPRFEPWLPETPYLRSGRRALTWSVEVPDADVSGQLRWPGGTLEVEGRGYRDRVWFDLLPWRFPFDRLVWGRAVTGNHAAIWNGLRTDSGSIAHAWIDGQPTTPHAGLSAPPDPIQLGPDRVVLDSDVADLKGLRLGPLRRPFAWLSRSPHETKWQAPATIAGEAGTAIHEVVTWH